MASFRLREGSSKAKLMRVANANATPMAKTSPNSTARLDSETCQREDDFMEEVFTNLTQQFQNRLFQIRILHSNATVFLKNVQIDRQKTRFGGGSKWRVDSIGGFSQSIVQLSLF